MIFMIKLFNSSICSGYSAKLQWSRCCLFWGMFPILHWRDRNYWELWSAEQSDDRQPELLHVYQTREGVLLYRVHPHHMGRVQWHCHWCCWQCCCCYMCCSWSCRRHQHQSEVRQCWEMLAELCPHPRSNLSWHHSDAGCHHLHTNPRSEWKW